jgi:hypothetical protein
MKTWAPAAPGVARRAARAELWLRDADGRALRPVTLPEAEALVSAGAAFPIVASGNWKEVRLNTSLPPRSLQTFTGHAAAALGNPRARYNHNQRACRTWKH